MKSFRPFASLAILLLCTFLVTLVAGTFANTFAGGLEIPTSGMTNGLAGGVLAFAFLGVTLTTQEILSDVMDAFKKRFPFLSRMGTDFRPSSLKLDQTYTAHIPTLPSVSTYDTTTGYANGATSARSLLQDVNVLVSNHKHVPLKFEHINAIKDNKSRYEQVIGLTGYALGKAVIDDGLGKITAARFSRSSTFATDDCDFDMLVDVCGNMNSVGALPEGRTMLINTAVANTLSADSRITSRDYSAQFPGGQGYRQFRDVSGFGLIQEYPDFPTNNGSTLNITGVASTDVITTSAAHGLGVGDIVTIPTISGGSGITASATTRLYVLTVPSSTTLTLSTTQGGSTLNFTTDISSGTLVKTENLTAFGFDMRAMALLAGIPDNADQGALAAMLGIQQVMTFNTITDPDSGLTMMGVAWQALGTGDLYYSPALVWGWALGRQTYDQAAGAKADYAGHRVITA